MFKGAYTALITPFSKDGSINYKKIDELIEFQIANDIDGIVICGTTGESATFSDAEKRKLIKHTVKTVKGRIPVIAGTGSNNTKHTIALSKYAQSVGASALLLVTPYYNKTSQQGLIEHYTAIASEVTIPCILYNVPSRTGINIEPDTVVKLSKIENIVGIKDASGNFSNMLQYMANVNNNFSLLSGNDDMILPILSLGGSGVISVLSNIYPKDVHMLCCAFSQNDFSYALNLQLMHAKLIKLLFMDVNPMPIKTAMNILGHNVGICRLPLIKTNDNVEELLKQLLLENVCKC